MTHRPVIFVVPESVDDPARVSGGNVYDRHVRDELAALGWSVSTVQVRDAGGAASTLRRLPSGATVLLDGLVAGSAPAEVAAAAGRVRLVVLAHMVTAAFADATAAAVAAEQEVLGAAHRVVVTSRWTAGELSRRGLTEPRRVIVAVPGVAAPVRGQGEDEASDPDPRTDEVPAEHRLLCVGVVAPHKGQDVLLAALARLPRRDWACTIVGSSDAAPAFAATVARDARAFDGRVRLTGVLHGAALTSAYRHTAVLVAPSRVESAGMAIVDARARGIPVIAADVGGIADTVAGGGAVLVRPDDPGALAGALDEWMTDPALRRRLRSEAADARTSLPTWADTAAAVSAALVAVGDTRGAST